MGHQPGQNDLLDVYDDCPEAGPSLGFGLSEVIHTGHTANIFSIKFAPGTNSRRLVSAAGDNQIRIFDLANAAALGKVAQAKQRGSLEWQEWGPHDGALLKVLRCHTDRVKRIATEDTPNIFLTCSEDGTVRQHDLRVPHECSRDRLGCGPPLVSYAREGLSLYSLSVSQHAPWQFVVAGTSPYAYLHDRRMNPRLTFAEWGVRLRPDALTQCVRRFGVPPRDNGTGPNHVTAVKLSDSNARDLIVSYSGDNIYLFDIYGDTAEPQSPATNAADSKPKMVTKRPRSTLSVAEPDPDGDRKVPRAGDDDGFDKGTAGDGTASAYMPQHATEETSATSQTGLPNVSGDVTALDFDPAPPLIEPSEVGSPSPAGGSSSEPSGSEGLVESDAEPTAAEEHAEDVDLRLRYRRVLFNRLTSAPRPQPEADVPLVHPVRKYSGHQNEQTIKGVNFAGSGTDRFVVTGSDDGNFFVFERDTAELVAIYEGDGAVVNVMTSHPFLPIMAVSGIDDTVKLFASVGAKGKLRYGRFDQRDTILSRNQSRMSRGGLGLGTRLAHGALMALLRGAADNGDEDGFTHWTTLHETAEQRGDCRVM